MIAQLVGLWCITSADSRESGAGALAPGPRVLPVLAALVLAGPLPVLAAFAVGEKYVLLIRRKYVLLVRRKICTFDPASEKYVLDRYFEYARRSQAAIRGMHGMGLLLGKASPQPPTAQRDKDGRFAHSAKAKAVVRTGARAKRVRQ
jgi:hypothetical protein